MSNESALEIALRAHMDAESGQLARIDERLSDLSEFTAVFRSQLPDLIQEMRRVSDRLDSLERDVAMLRPIQDQIKDHERRLREVERSALKLSTQAAVIAAAIGSGLPLLFKLLGGNG